MTKAIWTALISGILGSVVPSTLSYLSSRTESAEAKIRAQIAYETLTESVKELQDASYAQAMQLARIEGRLEVRRPASTSSSSVHALSVEVPETVVKTTPSELKAPPTFESAVKIWNAKK